MGCDYYTVKMLHIYYNENDYLRLELCRERGYYYHHYDEDADDYEIKLNEYIKKCLTPLTEPIVIYNGAFNKPTSERKYKSIVENKINNFGKTWRDVTKIIKVELKYERN